MRCTYVEKARITEGTRNKTEFMKHKTKILERKLLGQAENFTPRGYLLDADMGHRVKMSSI